jgi:hypothetical protein
MIGTRIIGLFLYKWNQDIGPCSLQMEPGYSVLFYTNGDQDIEPCSMHRNQNTGLCSILMEKGYRALFHTNGTTIQELVLYK